MSSDGITASQHEGGVTFFSIPPVKAALPLTASGVAASESEVTTAVFSAVLPPMLPATSFLTSVGVTTLEIGDSILALAVVPPPTLPVALPVSTSEITTPELEGGTTVFSMTLLPMPLAALSVLPAPTAHWVIVSEFGDGAPVIPIPLLKSARLFTAPFDSAGTLPKSLSLLAKLPRGFLSLTLPSILLLSADGVAASEFEGDFCPSHTSTMIPLSSLVRNRGGHGAPSDLFFPFLTLSVFCTSTCCCFFTLVFFFPFFVLFSMVSGTGSLRSCFWPSTSDS
mmetsp:Transcript_10794/g.21414  ORF Transcript_10794/g.21414 Transcript_10794/m.21414 type:complete len:282 (-) Transcript_10794:992-1837(-)